MYFTSLKKRISRYFTSTDWPWEIMGGLFVTLLAINFFSTLFTEEAGVTWTFLITVLVVNLFWATIEGLLFIFTSLLYRGHYNSKIAKIRSADDESATRLILAELEESIISVTNEKTKRSVMEALLQEFSSGIHDNPHAIVFSGKYVLGALWVIFFAMLPSVTLLPIFILISDMYWAVAISNTIGAIVFFTFGYRLATSINRNKLITGLITTVVGLALVATGIFLGA